MTKPKRPVKKDIRCSNSGCKKMAPKIHEPCPSCRAKEESDIGLDRAMRFYIEAHGVREAFFKLGNLVSGMGWDVLDDKLTEEQDANSH